MTDTQTELRWETLWATLTTTEGRTRQKALASVQQLTEVELAAFITYAADHPRPRKRKTTDG